MTIEAFNKIVNYIVEEGVKINEKYLDGEAGPIDYLAIFSRNEDEKNELLDLVNSLGEIIEDTPTGSNYKLKNPISTSAGPVKILKIRNSDPLKSHRGAPDFGVKDYEAFTND